MEMHTAIETMKEARATLHAVLDRLTMNDVAGEETPYINDCEVAIEMLDSALKSAGHA